MGTTEKKNQHFVPKFYLRLFSFNCNELEIGLFNINHTLFKERVSLKKQAKGTFFYGKDGKLEDWLSDIEGLVAPLFHKIIKNNSLDSINKDEGQLLILFTLLLAFRTKDAVDEMHNNANVLLKQMMEYDPRLKDIPKDIQIEFKEPAQMLVGHLMEKFWLAMDLKFKLIVNKSSNCFITSDNPVFMYNQYLEHKNHKSGHYGLLTKGLQLFLPISPNHTIVFYDEWAYKVGDKKRSKVEITNASEADQFNKLQLINCNENIYFNEKISDKYVNHLIFRNATRGTKERMQIEEHGTLSDKSKQNKLHSYKENWNLNLIFSFISFTKKAKEHTLSDYILQLRNEELRTSKPENYMKRSRLKPIESLQSTRLSSS